jgi:hypothetical protein
MRKEVSYCDSILNRSGTKLNNSSALLEGKQGIGFTSPRDQDSFIEGKPKEKRKSQALDAVINFDKIKDEDISMSHKLAVSILNSPNGYGSLSHTR